MQITTTRTGKPKERPRDEALGFGRFTTDHIFLLDYGAQRGWHDARIEPYGPLALDPAAMVLHYNQEVFEGLKAYRLDGGGVGLFRPGRNIARMNASARRLVMPEIDEALFLEALKALVRIEAEWIPRSEGTSLYLRPTMIATEAALGVRPARQYLFYIIASPVGSYYPGGFAPTKILVTDRYVRAARGGVGEVKTSGNYAPTLAAFEEAGAEGCAQVLWLDALCREFIEEVGTSNIFLRMGDRLVTPPLGGTILNGVTRDSVLRLAGDMGLDVEERPVSIHELVAGCRSGELRELFATGTAAVVSPVGAFRFGGEDFTVAGGGVGEWSRRFYDEITGIQYGRGEDRHDWLMRIP